jgi:hypothetical protein
MCVVLGPAEAIPGDLGPAYPTSSQNSWIPVGVGRANPMLSPFFFRTRARTVMRKGGPLCPLKSLGHLGNKTFFFFFFFVVLELEFRAYTLSHSTSLFFVLGIFEIGSHELFSRADFELRSS